MQRDFIFTAHSTVHGTGVFAKCLIPKGTRIIEYAGRRIPLADYNAAYRENTVIYGFTTDGETVIDGNVDGNDARFINHSCAPNCEAISFERERIYIYAIDDIAQGSELSFDYHLAQAHEGGHNNLEQWVCRCGAAACRGSLLAAAN
jgi:uncharacterized protein